MIRHYLRTYVVALFAFLLLLVFTAPLHAQEQSGKSCLFKITSSKGTVYLLGSMHLMKESVYPLPETIERAFQESSDVVFEINIGEMESPQAQEIMLRKSLFTDGRTLSKVLKPATYEKLKEAAKSLNLDVVQLDSLKPWSMAMALVVIKMNQLGFSPEAGVDRYFYRKAVNAGREISGLETMEMQLNLMDGLSMAQQDMLVSQTLDDFADMGKTVDDMMIIWKNGEMDKIEQMITDSFRDYPALYNTLFVKRNKRWASQVGALLAQKKTIFVVVGAGHLVGKNNLLELLRRKGYTVEQM
ncbi:MAG: TraB/GumN family protein [Syntrophobacterales bacterium]|jgi:uncharacterized protein YbaP (TraB family)|nr:TraB/GumN family protein [Syntrophobacterales bacterium]